MEVKSVLDLLERLRIISIEPNDHVLNITVISTQMFWPPRNNGTENHVKL